MTLVWIFLGVGVFIGTFLALWFIKGILWGLGYLAPFIYFMSCLFFFGNYAGPILVETLGLTAAWTVGILTTVGVAIILGFIFWDSKLLDPWDDAFYNAYVKLCSLFKPKENKRKKFRKVQVKGIIKFDN